MLNSTIGFIGSDKAELIHYLSRILINLSKKVLLVDYSETQALTYSIPIPIGITAMEVINYRGVDFTSRLIGKKEYEAYDFIFIDFGFQDHPIRNQCKEIILVTDLQIHNVKRLTSFRLSKCQNRIIIIKDIIKGKIGTRYVLEELKELCINETNCYEIPLDESDLKNSINCQYNEVFTFKGSYELRDMFREILDLYFDKKEILRAYKLAARGR